MTLPQSAAESFEMLKSVVAYRRVVPADASRSDRSPEVTQAQVTACIPASMRPVAIAFSTTTSTLWSAIVSAWAPEGVICEIRRHLEEMLGVF